MRYIYVIFFMLLLVLGWVFGIQNGEVLSYPVTFRIHLWLIGIETFPIPLGGLLVLAIFFGGVGASLFLLGRELKMQKKLLHKKSEIRQLEREVKELRQQTLSEPFSSSPTDDSADKTVTASRESSFGRNRGA